MWFEAQLPTEKDGMTAPLRISLFGGFRIQGEYDAQVRLTGKRGAGIIAYLARCPGMAAPREKLADLLEDLVLLMTKHPADGGRLCVTLLRLLVRNAEVARNFQHVPFSNLDSFVAATIRGTLRAIEHHS